MASANSFDPEAYEAIKRAVSELDEGAFSKIKGAYEKVYDLAKQSGMTRLIQSCENAEGGIDAMVTIYNGMMEDINKYLTMVNAIQEGTC